MNSKAIIFIICVLSAALLGATANAYQVTFHPRVTVTSEYTDNRERASTEEIDDQEDEAEDVITTISPGFALAVTGRTQGITLEYDPYYRWYQESQDDNTLGHSADLEIYKQATRNTRLYIQDSLRYTDDPTIEHLDGEQVDREGREPYYANRTTVGFETQFGRSDVFTLDYNYNILENEEDDLDDSVEKNPTAALTYYPVRNTGVELMFSFTQGEFDNDDDDVEPADDFENYFVSSRLNQRLSRSSSVFIGYNRTVMDFDKEEDANYELHYPNAGVSYQLEETTDISISLGYLVTDRKEETDELRDDERLLVNADIAKIWSFRTAVLRVTGSSGYDESFFDEDNLGLRVYYDADAIFTHEFLRGISYEIDAGYRVDQYLNTDPDRVDHTRTIGAGLVYSRIDFLTARVDYDYRDVLSDEDEEEYVENRISFSITLTPRNPIYLRR